jgi:hypothetical protein
VVEFDSAAHVTLFNYVGLKEYIASLFDSPVDVVNGDGLKPYIRTCGDGPRHYASSAATAALRDIAHHIDLPIHFTVGFGYEVFVADPCTVYAVTRRLKIISEASRPLPNDLKTRHPSIAWKGASGCSVVRPASAVTSSRLSATT